jgi:glycosyltransferase involved in cell wall biosynthesis
MMKYRQAANDRRWTRKNKAETMCRDLGIGDSVRFLGKLEAVEEVLSVADLFLMPSEKELWASRLKLWLAKYR